MANKHFLRNLRRKFAYVGLLFCAFIARIAKEKQIYPFASFITKFGFRFAKTQRQTAFLGLQVAFSKEKSQQEIKKIAEDSFSHMAMSSMEILYYLEHHKDLKKKFYFEGKENLENALAKKRGVISVAAHFGNFPLQQLFMAIDGYPSNCLLRHMRDPSADLYFLKRRNEFNLKTIYTEPRIKCVQTCMRALRNNEIVFILMDQNFGTGGVFVDFFGKKAATATGPVVLALRTKASIIAMFTVRDTNNALKIIIEPEIQIEEKEDYDKTVLFNVQKITNIFEKYIRKYPAEWGWIHRRWKTRPKGVQ
jgi:KDO2-lipid IV(A) lauroyltransferase